jgi:hypothetical protein
MNMLSETPVSPRERLLETLLGVSCALEEVSAVFRTDTALDIHLARDLHALRVSADALIQRLAD